MHEALGTIWVLQDIVIAVKCERYFLGLWLGKSLHVFIF